MVEIIIAIILAYLCGSISNAIIFCKIYKLQDPRKIGSKNPGTTNVFRINKKLGILVLFLDIIKGMIPIWIGHLLKIPTIWIETLPIIIGIGHIYPIFFNFSGGKGVATTFGSFAAINLKLSAIMLFIWIITIITFRISSLASIITFIITPIYALWYKYEFTTQIIILSIIILLKHYNNIEKLIKKKKKYKNYKQINN